MKITSTPADPRHLTRLNKSSTEARTKKNAYRAVKKIHQAPTSDICHTHSLTARKIPLPGFNIYEQTRWIEPYCVGSVHAKTERTALIAARRRWGSGLYKAYRIERRGRAVAVSRAAEPRGELRTAITLLKTHTVAADRFGNLVLCSYEDTWLAGKPVGGT